jgi:hypothetical protein
MLFLANKLPLTNYHIQIEIEKLEIILNMTSIYTVIHG